MSTPEKQMIHLKCPQCGRFTAKDDRKNHILSGMWYCDNCDLVYTPHLTVKWTDIYDYMDTEASKSEKGGSK
jgi:ribosomal protein L37AE/L43A